MFYKKNYLDQIEFLINLFDVSKIRFAEVAELVDALGSGSSRSTPVGVRVSPSAPLEIKGRNPSGLRPFCFGRLRMVAGNRLRLQSVIFHQCPPGLPPCIAFFHHPVSKPLWYPAVSAGETGNKYLMVQQRLHPVKNADKTKPPFHIL